MQYSFSVFFLFSSLGHRFKGEGKERKMFSILYKNYRFFSFRFISSVFHYCETFVWFFDFFFFISTLPVRFLSIQFLFFFFFLQTYFIYCIEISHFRYHKSSFIFCAGLIGNEIKDIESNCACGECKDLGNGHGSECSIKQQQSQQCQIGTG